MSEERINRIENALEKAADVQLGHAKDIQALFAHQVKLTEDIGRLETAIEETNASIRAAAKQAEADRQAMNARMDRFEKQAEADRKTMQDGFAETRDAINKLLGIVENTRDFAQKVARLAVASEKRLTNLEGRVDKLEQPQP